MTRERVREDFVTFGIGYVAGLLALLVWPRRDEANQDGVLLVGMAILVITAVVAEFLLFKRRPSLEWGSRPGRYSVLNFVGIVAATLIVSWLRTNGVAGWGLVGYAVAALVLLAGTSIANELWARRAVSQPE